MRPTDLEDALLHPRQREQADLDDNSVRDTATDAEADAATSSKAARTRVSDELRKKWAEQIERARRGRAE